MRAVVVALLLVAAALFVLWSGSGPAPITAPPAGATSGTDVAAERARGAPRAGIDAAPTPTELAVERSAVAADAAEDAALLHYRLHIVDPDGASIADAEASWLGNPALVLHTDDDGRCTLPVPPGERAYLLRIALGMRHAQRYRNPPTDDEQQLTLPWVGPLRGRCVDFDSGAPIAAVRVSRHHSTCKQCEPDTAIADRDGAFELPAVPRERDEVFVFEGEGYAHQYERLRLPGRGEAVDVTFRLRQGVVVAGRFVDSETRAPVAGARLSVGGIECGVSAADGTFSVRLLPDTDDALAVDVTCDGYCRHGYTLRAGVGNDYGLVRTASLAGTVRSSTGAPVADAGIMSIRAHYEPLPGHPENCRLQDTDRGGRTKSDAAGHFVLAGLVPGATYMLRATHGDYSRPRGFVTAVLRPDAPAPVLQLEPMAKVPGAGVLTGRLLVNGAPGPGTVRWSSAGRGSSIRVGADGVFRFDNVTPGAVELVGRPERYDRIADDRLRAQRSVQLGDGQELAVELQLTIDELAVTGHVRRADGTPVAGQWLWARADGGLRLRAQADDQGRYELLVPRAIAAVTIGTGDSAEPKERVASPGENGVDFVLPLAGELRYRVTGAGRVLDYPQVLLRRDDGEDVHSRGFDAPDPDGYRAIAAPRGDYTLVIANRGFAPAVRRVTIGERVSVDCELLAGHDVVLRLASDAAALPEGARVELVPAGLTENLASLLSINGFGYRVRLGHEAATMHHVGRGRHRLVVQNAGDIQLVPDAVDVQGADVEIDLRWRHAPPK